MKDSKYIYSYNFLLIAVFAILAMALASLSSCVYTERITDGETAVERKQYAVAIKLLDSEFERARSTDEKGRIAYLKAQSFENIGRIEEAANWYNQSYELDYGPDALKGYAYTLKRQEKYEEAINAFTQLGIEIGTPYEYRREIAACRQAAGWKQLESRSPYEIATAGFNSRQSDYSPVFFGADELIFVSDRNTTDNEESYEWTGRSFTQLYIAGKNGNSARPLDWFDYPYHEGPLSIHPSGTWLVTTRCGSRQRVQDDYCALYISQKTEAGTWTAPEKLPFCEPGINYMHPAWFSRGEKLLFASDDPSGLGGYDLYEVNFRGDSWSEPKNLGRPINTSGNEVFPWFDQDTLYFSSDYHIGMGGLDIFSVIRQETGWSPVHNMLPPINSSGDDFGFIIRHQQDASSDLLAEGFFSSSRDGVTDNIYRFSKRELPPAPEPEVPIVAGNMYLDIFVLEKIYENPNNPSSRLMGRSPLEGARLEVFWGDSTIAGITPRTEPLRLKLNPNKEYFFTASKSGYLNTDAFFDPRSIAFNPKDGDQYFELEIEVDRIFLNQEIVIDDIFYDFDKWDIREDAEPALRRLADILNRNPGIQLIRLASHTDCRGSATYNRDLSSRRAQSAVEFLVDLGIDRNRLEAVGYGKDRLAVDCICSRCSEEEHQQNRRTTFTIVESDVQ